MLTPIIKLSILLSAMAKSLFLRAFVHEIHVNCHYSNHYLCRTLLNHINNGHFEETYNRVGMCKSVVLWFCYVDIIHILCQQYEISLQTLADSRSHSPVESTDAP